MEIRASYLLVGTVVMTLIAGLAAFSVWLVKADTARQDARYQIAFAGTVSGLQESSAVLYRGIPVGRVLADSTLQARLGKGAREAARRSSWEHVTDMQEEVYRRASAPAAATKSSTLGS